MNTKMPRVGFDLDGVLLYNPARNLRPVTQFLKKVIKKSKPSSLNFYIPKTKFEILIWRLVHWSSLYISHGYSDLCKKCLNKKIEAYIITSRYDCLKNDFLFWLKNLKAKKYFVGAYHNKNNMQPHIFKEMMIKQLNLQYFVEDNYDIVSYLSKNTSAKILWISNTLDRNISYKLKFKSLKEATNYINTTIS